MVAPPVSIFQDDWPVVRMEFSGEVTPAQMRDVIAQLLTLAARAESERCFIGLLALLDSLDASHITAGMRKEQIQLLQQNMPRLAVVTCAEARVVTRPVLRGILTAMSWVLPHPWPVEVFSEEREARQWLQQQCSLKQAAPKI